VIRLHPSELVAIPPSTDHLLPEESPLLLSPLGYFQSISAALLSEGGLLNRGEACVVCLPSFSPEWAVRLRPSGGKSLAIQAM
jgi:hypothetical protein